MKYLNFDNLDFYLALIDLKGENFESEWYENALEIAEDKMKLKMFDLKKSSSGDAVVAAGAGEVGDDDD